MSSQDNSAESRPEKDSTIDIPDLDDVPGVNNVPILITDTEEMVERLQEEIREPEKILKEWSDADPDYAKAASAALDILETLTTRAIENYEISDEIDEKFKETRSLAEKFLADNEENDFRMRKLFKEPEGDEAPQLVGGEFEEAMKV